VPSTAYKNQRIPHKGKLCLVCQLQTRGVTQLVQLTHGVSLWLCTGHASESFRSRRLGRDFNLTILRAWTAAGCLTRDRVKALEAHLRQYESAPPRREGDLPGSYHWKALRNETEHRAAGGATLQSILDDLRSRHAHDVADAPSERTIRRWYHDGRWRRNHRTPLRKGYDRRDPAKASRAQRDRVAITRLRETHGSQQTRRE
jgi:hypothetical protein